MPTAAQKGIALIVLSGRAVQRQPALEARARSGGKRWIALRAFRRDRRLDALQSRAHRGYRGSDDRRHQAAGGVEA